MISETGDPDPAPGRRDLRWRRSQPHQDNPRPHPQFPLAAHPSLPPRKRLQTWPPPSSRGSDDFIRKPFDEHELRARTRAAQIRWQSQATLLKEREFYRIAVAEEERLSSLVLDQNQSLKDAYDKIRRLNEELEKANRELEQIAAYDSLSGLLNRRSLFTRIAIEIERSIRLDVPLAGLMIDIDRFKGINDNYGHQCGDMVIREIGARLSRRAAQVRLRGALRRGGVLRRPLQLHRGAGARDRRAVPQGHGGSRVLLQRGDLPRHGFHRRVALSPGESAGVLDRAGRPRHVPGQAGGPQRIIMSA